VTHNICLLFVYLNEIKLRNNTLRMFTLLFIFEFKSKDFEEKI